MKAEKMYLVFFFVIFSSFAVSAAMDPAPSFCENQGYTLLSDTLSGEEKCVFDDGKSCDMREFYRGDCGEEYRREFPCVELGNVVFEYEKCCEGKPYLPSFVIGQSSCQSFSTRIKGNLENTDYWIKGVTLLLIVGVLYGLYRWAKRMFKR